MRITRIFIDLPLREKAEFLLNKEITHRLQNVLRLRHGAPLIVFNGQGGEYEAKFLTIEKHAARVVVHRFLKVSRESTLKMHLVQGIPRAEKMDYILQKSVELGVASIAPVITEYSPIRLDPSDARHKRKRWQDLVIAAAEQCGRNQLPTLYPPKPLDEWLGESREDTPTLLLHPGGNTKLKELPTLSEVTLLVGPEGGFSEAEVSTSCNHGFYRVDLGPRILRTETASIVAFAALLALWGDF